MEVVHSQTESEQQRRKALEDLKFPFREMAANLLRVVRGAGAPQNLPQQMQDCVDVCHAHFAAVGHWPDPQEISNILNPTLAVREHRPWIVGARSELNDDERQRGHAEDKVVRGALQRVASVFVDQPTQATRGLSEMYDGLSEITNLNRKKR